MLYSVTYAVTAFNYGKFFWEFIEKYWSEKSPHKQRLWQ